MLSLAAPITLAALVASEAASGGFNQVAKFVGDDGDNNDDWNKVVGADHQFGNSVAIDGNFLVVGANGDAAKNVYSGRAFVFATTNSGATWSKKDELIASDAAGSDYWRVEASGDSVAIRGDIIVVGAPADGARHWWEGGKR